MVKKSTKSTSPKTKQTIKYDYDVAVIGGGPAGMMAAIQASQPGLKVVLIEKNSKLGKKLLLTGNGRCNLTNAEFDLKNLVSNYHNGEFLFHAFSVFGPKDTVKFFDDLNVKTKVESGKRVFPVSNNANDVLDALKKYLENNNVSILYNSEIKDIIKKGKNIDKIFLKTKSDSAERFVTVKKYILATGGKSFPKTGSDGFGYKMAEKLGHTIVKPSPALSSIILKENPTSVAGFDVANYIKDLQGINLADVKITVALQKPAISEEGEILFTHFGISGPAILNISGKISNLLEKGPVKIMLDLFPLLTQEQLLKGLEDDLKKYPNRSIKNILSIFIPTRLSDVLLKITGIDESKIANNMSKPERASVVKILKNIELTPEDVMGFEAAYVTKGGISLKEIDHKTMQSKIIDNLFFAGEIIDVDGKSGGFNLQMCWSTGYLAGKRDK